MKRLSLYEGLAAMIPVWVLLAAMIHVVGRYDTSFWTLLYGPVLTGIAIGLMEIGHRLKD